ncbi:hypothetical protein ACFLY8_01225 [Halobacteriota archaeon]
MKWKIGLVLILVLSMLTVAFSGCVGEKVIKPTQPMAPRVKAAPTPNPKPKQTQAPTAILIPTPTPPQEVSQPEQIKLSGSGPGIKGTNFIDILEK